MSRLAFLGLVLGAWLATPAAFALTTSTSQTAITIGQTIERRNGRLQDLKQTDISRADCVANDTATFALSLPSGTVLEDSFQVWAGSLSGCGTPDGRATLGSACRLVTSYPRFETRVVLPVQDILPIPTADPATGNTVSACDQGDPSAPSEVTLYFQVVRTSTLVANGQIVFKYDLRGPIPPTGVSLGTGERRLYPKWTASDSSDVLGYRVFCEAIGATADAGVGACEAPTLVPGSMPLDPAPAAQNPTSVTGEDATRGEVKGLTNYEVYACGVAGVDEFGNLGTLSALTCGFPVEVTGYFDAYRSAGGNAGGGYCSLGSSGSAVFGFPVALAALAFVLRRRQRACNSLSGKS